MGRAAKEEEAKRILQYVKEKLPIAQYQLLDFYIFLAEISGLRIAELLQLTVNDLFLCDVRTKKVIEPLACKNTLKVESKRLKGGKRSDGKGKPLARVIPLSANNQELIRIKIMESVLDQPTNGSQFIFSIQQNRKKPVSSRLIQHIFQQATTNLNIQGVVSHSFRKKFALNIHGLSDLETTRIALGHSSVATTALYLNREIYDVDNVIIRAQELKNTPDDLYLE